MRQLLERAEQAAVRPIPVEPERLQAMVGPTRHQGVVALCARLENAHSLQQVLEKISPDSLLLLLDGITDPRNLGACLRTAEAAAVTAVGVPRGRSAPRASAGVGAASGGGGSGGGVPGGHPAPPLRGMKGS